MLFSFVCHFSRILCSLSVPRRREWAELYAVLRTEIMREGTCWDSLQWLPSVTLLKCNLFSYVPLTQDIECFLALWRLLFAWLCSCSFFFYCLKLPCVKIYKYAFLQIKHPCFTRDLGTLRPSSHRLQSPGPGLQRPWHMGIAGCKVLCRAREMTEPGSACLVPDEFLKNGRVWPCGPRLVPGYFCL